MARLHSHCEEINKLGASEFGFEWISTQDNVINHLIEKGFHYDQMRGLIQNVIYATLKSSK